jgi:hypothetical protein
VALAADRRGTTGVPREGARWGRVGAAFVGPVPLGQGHTLGGVVRAVPRVPVALPRTAFMSPSPSTSPPRTSSGRRPRPTRTGEDIPPRRPACQGRPPTIGRQTGDQAIVSAKRFAEVGGGWAGSARTVLLGSPRWVRMTVFDADVRLGRVPVAGAFRGWVAPTMELSEPTGWPDGWTWQ